MNVAETNRSLVMGLKTPECDGKPSVPKPSGRLGCLMELDLLCFLSEDTLSHPK